MRKELSRRGYRPRTMAIGTNTDPYQALELRERVMRGCLDVLWEFRHPLAITTKGALIERDLDILAPMAAEGLVQVGISVTTLDAGLARKMEPRVPSPTRRLKAIERLARAGVPVRVCASPMIPGLTDHELEAILEAAVGAGAQAASWVMLRLPRDVARLFQEWLEDALPGQAQKVLKRVREAHGGKDYDPAWHRRLRGQGLAAELIEKRYQLALKRLSISETLPALRCDLFAVPKPASEQRDLFAGPPGEA